MSALDCKPLAGRTGGLFTALPLLPCRAPGRQGVFHQCVLAAQMKSFMVSTPQP